MGGLRISGEFSLLVVARTAAEASWIVYEYALVRQLIYHEY
jgi:hypothetical protein